MEIVFSDGLRFRPGAGWFDADGLRVPMPTTELRRLFQQTPEPWMDAERLIYSTPDSNHRDILAAIVGELRGAATSEDPHEAMAAPRGALPRHRSVRGGRMKPRTKRRRRWLSASETTRRCPDCPHLIGMHNAKGVCSVADCPCRGEPVDPGELARLELLVRAALGEAVQRGEQRGKALPVT